MVKKIVINLESKSKVLLKFRLSNIHNNKKDKKIKKKFILNADWPIIKENGSRYIK
jgi:hypothetical protein